MAGRLGLVFSGGGAKGAFGVGALHELLRLFPRLRWHVVSGTSTGALIAPFAALAADDPAIVTTELRELYRTARRTGIVASNLRFPHVLSALFDFPQGLHNAEPLRRRIELALPEARRRRLAGSEVVTVLNAVDLATGQLVVWTQERHRDPLRRWFDQRSSAGTTVAVEFLPEEELVKAMVASCAIPGAIEPVEHAGRQLVDGGVIDIAPLRAAVAAGATDVLAILMNPRVPREAAPPRANALAVAMRAVDLLTDEILRNDVETARRVTRLRGLARALLEERDRLPPRTREAVDREAATVADLAARRDVAVHVVEPPTVLGDTLDFDSVVPRGWPGAARPGRPLGVMLARHRAGRRALRLRVASDPELRDTLVRYSS